MMARGGAETRLPSTYSYEHRQNRNKAGCAIISSSGFIGNLYVCTEPVFKVLMVQVTVQTKCMLHTQLFAVWLCNVRCQSGLRPVASRRNTSRKLKAGR